MSKLVHIDPPTRLPTMHIVRYVDKSHASWPLLRHLVDVHPVPFSTGTLILCLDLTGNAHAALAWHVMRVNDTLPLVGWKIEIDGADRHSLVPITDAHHQRLVERYEARRVA